MGLLEVEISELRTLLKDVDNGYYDNPEMQKQLQAKLNIYARIEKRAAMMLQAYSIAAKHNKYGIKKLEAANVLGSGSAIKLVDIEKDSVNCPIKDNEQISRTECLEYSSSHLSECETCQNFGPTRKMILGEKP